jgi:putative addiction module CopG family antidote
VSQTPSEIYIHLVQQGVVMSNRMVSLPPDLYDFVQARVEHGRYENAGELMRAALLALNREERALEKRRLTDSIADGDVFRRLWEKSVQSSSEMSRR